MSSESSNSNKKADEASFDNTLQRLRTVLEHDREALKKINSASSHNSKTQKGLFTHNNIKEADVFGKNDAYDEFQKELDKNRRELFHTGKTARKLAKELQALKERKDNHKLRKKYIHKLSRLIETWLFFNAILIIFHALDFGWLTWFKLSDNVLIVLLTTTTATVLGLFAIAARWLFPNSKNTKEEKK
ncbi:hypothetical protein KRX19_05725 [Cardiobacteriaceae bacterium TAE3-ERU3]|nr:hypothetical protein [Cardiobacteriaceae bacterium TAE3-ERU3]